MQEFFSSILGQILSAVQAKIASSVELAPYILGSLATFFFGWILAVVAAKAIVSMSDKLRLEKLSEFLGLAHFLKNTGVKKSPSQVIAKSMKAYIIFVFFIEATKIAKLTEIADFLVEVRGYIPEFIIALFIILVGIRIGNTLKLVVETSLSITRSNTSEALGIAAKSTVVSFAVLAALAQLQIAESLIQILFIGFVSMLAIAGGLAFGLGGKDVVKELLEALKNMELIEYMQAKQEAAKQNSKTDQ